MSAYGGRGPMVNGVLSMLLVIMIFFVGLRIYTRAVLLNALGFDDLFVVLALILQIVNNIFVGISSQYGLGQHYEAIGNPLWYIEAAKWELFSHATLILSNGVAKIAVAIFLLRILRKKWHLWLVWICLLITAFFALFGTIACVIQCLPIEKIWNKTLPGKCWLDFLTFGFFISGWYSISDFAFAILPWFAIWNLNMKRKEKILVASGLSLGILAGICGIVGLVSLIGQINISELQSINYLYTSTSVLVWSSTENTITILCACIPMLRPLWVRVRYGSQGKTTDSSDRSWEMQNHGSHSAYVTSQTDGQKKHKLYRAESVKNIEGPYQKTEHYSTSHSSDDTILRGAAAIERVDEVEIRYERNGTGV